MAIGVDILKIKNRPDSLLRHTNTSYEKQGNT